MTWRDRRFSDQYAETKRVLTNSAAFGDGWDRLVAALRFLMAESGFDGAQAERIEELRRRLVDGANVSEDEGILDAAAARDSGAIEPAARKRAAALKFLRHMYLLRQRGSHEVWIHSLPSEFADWPHWALDVGTGQSVRQLLRTRNERFSIEQKRALSDAVQNGLKWCHRAWMVLGQARGSGTARAEAILVVRRWFADEYATEPEIDRCVARLMMGFKAITDTISRGQIVLTDHPSLRHAHGRIENRMRASEGFVWAQNQREALDVIYIEEAFFSADNMRGGVNNWTRILIHELSHLVCGTTDVEPGPRNAHFGVRPNVASFPTADAMRNAENWALFAADCAGALTEGDRIRSLKARP